MLPVTRKHRSMPWYSRKHIQYHLVWITHGQREYKRNKMKRTKLNLVKFSTSLSLREISLQLGMKYLLGGEQMFGIGIKSCWSFEFQHVEKVVRFFIIWFVKSNGMRALATFTTKHPTKGQRWRNSKRKQLLLNSSFYLMKSIDSPRFSLTTWTDSKLWAQFCGTSGLFNRKIGNYSIYSNIGFALQLRLSEMYTFLLILFLSLSEMFTSPCQVCTISITKPHIHISDYYTTQIIIVIITIWCVLWHLKINFCCVIILCGICLYGGAISISASMVTGENRTMG